MAASMEWRTKLNQHKIFHILRESTDKRSSGADSKDLLTVRDGELFVWNSYNQSLLTTNLKNLVAGAEDAEARKPYQILRCSNPPSYDVTSIKLNQTGTQLALIGKKGVSILTLPKKWGKYAEFEGGKEKILAKTTPLGERFFLTSNEKILDAKWHPGSLTDAHLMLLTSDNYLRIYNLEDPDRAEQSHSLSGVSTHGKRSYSSPLHIKLALGDTAVSFDYGPPTQLKRKMTAPAGAGAEAEYAWPVYILWGNGEVYLLMTKLHDRHPLKCRVRGPLSMHPPAEDNYGTEACSIICLSSRPPVLAVATCEGKIHHCVVLNRGEDEETQVEWAEKETGVMYHTIPDPSLFVYESVELELSLATPSLDTEEPIQDDFTCPIRLHKDPSHADRFHCSHAAGVHALVLPWTHKFTAFCDDETEDSELPNLSPEQQTIVEHIICTKPIASSPPSPVLGLTLLSDRLLGATMICLTNKPECITLPLLHTLRSPTPALLSASVLKQFQSPLRKMHKEPFDLHVQRILQRNASNPILKTEKNTELSPQESFQLLSRATQVFREQYIQKQEQAREEIQRRIRVLKDQKEQQICDLRECQQTKNILTDKAGDLAEKYEEANDKHQAIVYRLEDILKKLQSRLPMLSDAEKNMQKELQEMAQRLNTFKEKTKQLKIKQQYQDRQISTHRKSSASNAAAFSQSQTKQLRTVLKEEGDGIADLVKRVNQLKMNIEV